ncbi:WD40/YVTN/BNR-like repeat-containing protein [Croceivirga radicis]|uniref:WD40/YVTN/BNR-like repeat-containing protein n=1 Tax=Croceivirga radicis TaxID=1929488 RepID=UPI000255AA7D|nr:sialidase family protein [Croceivirga radicis]
MNRFYLLFALFLTTLVQAQLRSTSEEKTIEALQLKAKLDSTSLLKNLKLQNIGPSIMSGRVVDLAVNPADPTEFYVAYASGGLWHTTDNGISFTPIMDNSPTQNLGDIAVHWPTRTIWVGTGENNASRSSYAGIGLLKTTDNGKNWDFAGLADSHHIGRILINPNNPNHVVVGVTGHLYSTNDQRGVYSTKDGGKTWNRTLFINDQTGIIDLASASNNFNVLYAAAWQKDRKAWNFDGNGTGSGIYKSTDAGENWELVSTANSGFPTGNGVGRIGLSVYNDSIVYAVLDNQNRREKELKTVVDGDKLVKDDFKTMNKRSFLKLDNKKLNTFLKTNGFQEKYRAENVKALVRDDVVEPIDLAKYLEDANSLLFDTPVIGAEVYKSTNAGKTWVKTNTDYIDDLFYSYGYYFAQVNVDPNNPDVIYLAGVPLIQSKDGGKTFESIDKNNVHSDHHALWINRNKPGHLINGNDGGINITYNDGKVWSKNNAPSVGQFYAIAVDNEQPYNVYGGLQDNGVWKAPHTSENNNDWLASGKNPWEMLMGGDGMQVEIDARNTNIVYTGFQFGNYFRLNLETGDRKYIQPKHELGEAPYRFNWQTPIRLSHHNQDILYLGSNKLHRSMDKGETWTSISDDLTRGGKKGNVAYGTITTISESPFQFGLLYVGTDDGLIHVSKDGGANWTNVANPLPKDLWVTEIMASKHKKERVYATLNGYRWDNFTTYIYVSDDYGLSWKNIGETLPLSPVNAIVEDPVNESLLFVGTDNGLYASLDAGNHWQSITNGLPNVAVHDLVIQKRDKHLVVGTHGRSIYKLNIASLQKVDFDLNRESLKLFDVADIKHSKRWGNSWSSWGTPNTPGLNVDLYTNTETTFKTKIKTTDGIVVSAGELNADKGFNTLHYDVAFDKEGKANYLSKNKTKLETAKNGKTYLPKGEYIIEVSGNGATKSTNFKIE